MAEQKQFPHSPANPVIDAIVPTAPPAEAPLAAEDIPANAENLVVILCFSFSFRTQYTLVLHVFAFLPVHIFLLFVSYFCSLLFAFSLCPPLVIVLSSLGWGMVNSNGVANGNLREGETNVFLCEPEILSISNCKTELFEFSKYEPKTF